jgi:agmatine/peptidylarginine deiminase
MSASRIGGTCIQRSFRRRRRRWPAEWESHEWTILIAPHNPNTIALDSYKLKKRLQVKTLS